MTEKSGIPVVSSRKVAEIFSKEHKSVLRAIENATVPTSGLSEEFRQRNFVPSFYKNEQNKKQPEYLLTRDGFSFTAMGFTGKKAAQFKEAYINRFNEMESFIKNLYEAKAEFPVFTEAIMLTHEEPKHYHFSNEVDLINRIVLGMSARQFCEVKGIGKVPSIRPYLSPEQIKAIKKLQRIDIGLIVSDPDFHSRKQTLTDYYNRLRNIKVIAS
ncbi:MAG: Rha family transcriptional regulator [Smithella sp.]